MNLIITRFLIWEDICRLPLSVCWAMVFLFFNKNKNINIDANMICPDTASQIVLSNPPSSLCTNWLHNLCLKAKRTMGTFAYTLQCLWPILRYEKEKGLNVV